MHTEEFIYYHDEQACHGYVAYQQGKTNLPAVLIAHDWSGRNAFACEKAELLAQLGYVGFAIDMFGDGKQGTTTSEKQALIEPLVSNREFLLARIQASLTALKSFEQVNANQIAAIGFCFGGLCVLDLARSGADLAGVVSFHGLLNRPEGSIKPIHAKILALHGYDDPMVSPEQVHLFCEEMTKADADWQVHMYGQTKHAFTNPNAHDEKLGTVYEPQAERRSLQAMGVFLKEIFSK